MPEFIIPEKTKKKSIDDVGFRSDVVEYLHKHGFKTVRDVIDRQNDIPTKIFTSIKAKLIFNLDI